MLKEYLEFLAIAKAENNTRVEKQIYKALAQLGMDKMTADILLQEV